MFRRFCLKLVRNAHSNLSAHRGKGLKTNFCLLYYMADSQYRVLVVDVIPAWTRATQWNVDNVLGAGTTVGVSTAEQALAELRNKHIDAFVIGGELYEAGLIDKIRAEDPTARCYVVSGVPERIWAARSEGIPTYTKGKDGSVSELSKRLVADLRPQ